MSKLYILGAGGMGTALAVTLFNMGHEVSLWGHNAEHNRLLREQRENVRLLKGVEIPRGINIVDTLEGVCEARAIIIATPSVGVRETLKKLSETALPKIPIACTAKGFEPETLLMLHEVSAEVLPQNPFVALSGPSHAEEISQGVPTALVAASQSLEAARFIQDLTVNSHVRIYTSDDVVGVETGGALKNVIAFAAGVVDGMGGGDNAKAALMTRGLTEIARLGVKMGARSETFAGLSGVGDLIVTCCSMHSRNRRCGIFVGEGDSVKTAVEKVGMTVEGITASVCAYKLSQRLGAEMPITTQIYRLIAGEATAEEAVAELLSRPLRHETDRNWLRD